MRSLLFLVTFFTVINLASAQDISIAYDWDSNPQPHTLSVAESANKIVGLKDKRILEYFYDDEKKTDLVMYYTKHVIVKVNSTDGIEQFNRIYLPVGGTMDVLKIKARSISKEGKVVTLDQNNIKTSVDEESGDSYKYFAIDGLEPGSEVEYLFTMKYDANFFGNEKVQADYLKHNVSFDLYAPENFIFTMRSYNGLAEMQKDTAYAGGKHWMLNVDMIEPLREEKYAAYDANLQRVEYTLLFNTAASDERLLDWDAAARAFFLQYFEADKKEVSAVEKYLKKLDVQGSSDKEKVLWLDNYLKTNIALQQVSNPDLTDLRKIIENKAANSRGIMRLYIQILKAMKLLPELALTTNRYETHFDGTFETWNYLEEIMIYVPSLDIYLAADNFTSRGGLAPSELEDNDGLFVSPAVLNGKITGAGKVQHVQAADWSQSRHDIYADAQLVEPFDNVKVHVKQVMTGHAAEFVQAYYQFLSDDEKQKLLEPVVQLIGQDGKISNLKFTNDLNEDVSGRPFIIESDINIGSLIEKAGSRILFKIGNLIGEQVEMYSEENRQNDVENEFNRGYYREITFNIPDNYNVKNLDALNLNVDAKDGDKTPYYFHASYTVDGNKVKVTINEVYSQIRYPAAKFDDFKNVVNAAADWNKVVLILEKTN